MVEYHNVLDTYHFESHLSSVLFFNVYKYVYYCFVGFDRGSLSFVRTRHAHFGSKVVPVRMHPMPNAFFAFPDPFPLYEQIQKQKSNI